DQGEAFAKVVPELIAKNTPCSCTRTVGFVGSVVDDMLKKLKIVLHVAEGYFPEEKGANYGKLMDGNKSFKAVIDAESTARCATLHGFYQRGFRRDCHNGSPIQIQLSNRRGNIKQSCAGFHKCTQLHGF